MLVVGVVDHHTRIIASVVDISCRRSSCDVIVHACVVDHLFLESAIEHRLVLVVVGVTAVHFNFLVGIVLLSDSL